MNSSLSQECLVYPGEYVPMPETNALLHHHAVDTCISPAMNMNEGSESFWFEMIVPGIKRENIIIHLHDNILSIIVIPLQKREHTDDKQLVHEFDEGLMERHIILPANADGEFVSAEYKMGVLKLYIPKSSGIPRQCNRHIVVY